MNMFEGIVPLLEKLSSFILDGADADITLFNMEGHIVYCSDRYIRRKGHDVHSSSLHEVLTQDYFFVTHPGNMDSCVGCRFKGKCPSKFEILSSVKMNNQPSAILAMTAFTKRSELMMRRNLDKYTQLLSYLAELIAVVLQKEQLFSLSQASLELNDDALILLDCQGVPVHSTKKAKSWLARQEDTLQNVVTRLIETGNGDNQDRNELDISVTTHPIYDSQQLTGTVLHLRPLQERKRILPVKELSVIDRVIGQSPAMQLLKKRMEKIKNSPSTILITGETGTGKTLVAKAIHSKGKESEGPFVAINCSSIPDSLFESELFGYEEGAFTGARKGGKMGYFEMAHGGVLFLDEIGELPLHLQPKLLKVLQESTFQRVGGTKTIQVDVRIIAATNQDLEELVEQKKFRADLYYRLHVIPLSIPPLRERKEDIEPIVRDSIDRWNKKAGQNVIQGVHDDALKALYAYHWPGNIRELENAVEYALNIEESHVLTLESLPDRVLRDFQVDSMESDLKEEILTVERDIIRSKLGKYGYDYKGKLETASELGIGIRTLYRKIKDYNIE